MYYISFDSYYDWKHYNDFIINAKSNGYIFKEYISNRSNYRFYINIERKSDMPKFLKYDTLTDDKFLFEKLIPLNGAEENYLKRRSQIVDVEQFCSPRFLKDLKSASYAVCFKYQDIGKIKHASLAGIKTYILGKQGNYKLAVSFNKYINNYITMSDILLEKKSQSSFSKPLEFEYQLGLK